MEENYLVCPIDTTTKCLMDYSCVGCVIFSHHMMQQRLKDNIIKSLENKLEAWYEAFGTRQLTHAIDRLNVAENIANRVESGYYTKKESGGC